jgi:serine/threonine-protein kinase
VDAPGLVIIDSYSRLQSLPDSQLSDPNCFGALYAATEPAYAGRPVTTVRSQLLQEPTDSYSHRVVQAVVRFINADEAISYVNAEMSVWSQCSGRSVVWRDHGDGMTWDVGSLTRSADIAALPRTRSDDSGWACSHAMVPRLNVVADVSACGVGGNVVDESIALAQLVAGRIKA